MGPRQGGRAGADRMESQPVAARKTRESGPSLFTSDNGPRRPAARRRRSLILPKYLADEAAKEQYRGDTVDRAHQAVLKWANLDEKGHLLERKETAQDAEFLEDVFVKALGYVLHRDSPKAWTLDREFTVPGVGAVDGAIGDFRPGAEKHPVAVIELKSSHADLDRDKFNGRTPVQQCWDYLSALPDCPWGIVSNFLTLRLYHRNHTPMAYEEFDLQGLRDPRRFREFQALLEVGGLFRSQFGQPPRALRLLQETGERQREVGDDLYRAYRTNRLHLIEHLTKKLDYSLDGAIRAAQRLLDRIIFIAFCEDRGLLKPRTLAQTHAAVPPFAKATNPRWRNFMDLFHAMDRGHPNLELKTGFDGGLFHQDDTVDNLQLDDEWTDFFCEIGEYDFRDEVNVDVLGHLFEKSVTELEKIRQGGLFRDDAGEIEPSSRMPKSAKRKRFGIYYTPPQFTRYIVERTVDAVVDQRVNRLREQHRVNPDANAADQDPKRLDAYWRDCLAALRDIKVCDPACGSGAFLIQAYDVFEQHYQTVVGGLADRDPKAADALENQIPDIILGENLFGVDLSPEAAEITQLALWLRSARREKTLADLSRNVVVGNSLVTDPSVDPHAVDWRAMFPAVLDRPRAGFDCVIGNPPWERMKLQEREFFSFSAPEIAEAVSAATRRKLIARLETREPDLHRLYLEAKSTAETLLAHVRAAGEFPLTARGDINTYMLFAELARKLVAATGRVGLLVPSGIATDHTTREFFNTLIDTKALIGLCDFENKAPVFPDVHRSFKFTALVFGGEEVKTESADFVFFARTMEDLADRKRHIALTAADIALLNPNTRTCPIFRTNRDADLTRAIYRRVPVLVEESRGEAGNPWGIRFFTMFHQTNDAEQFHTAEQLEKAGYRLDGNVYIRRKSGRKKTKPPTADRFLPLYEAKMIQAYDHRAAGVVIEKDNWMRQGQTVATSLVSHQKPEFAVIPRWWASEGEVDRIVGQGYEAGFLGFKDITSPTNERTMIASYIPWCAVPNHLPLVFSDSPIRRTLCLLANLNAFVLDYAVRQKVGGVTLNFFIVNQLPMLPPDAYDQKCPWHQRQKLERWISDRVLKLTCTADDMRPLAEACGLKSPVHKWHPDERARLTAELDAAYFRLYGVSRDDVEYILSTFAVAGRPDQGELGAATPAKRILAAYDTLGS